MKRKEREVVAEVRRLRLTELRTWVSEGWVRPALAEDGPLFDDLDVARIRLICDLREEMSLPADVVPTVLSLLDQVHGLRRELRLLAEAVARQPEATRTELLKAYKGSVGRD
jgi:chaperone modulatory protein CbpM